MCLGWWVLTATWTTTLPNPTTSKILNTGLLTHLRMKLAKALCRCPRWAIIEPHTLRKKFELKLFRGRPARDIRHELSRGASQHQPLSTNRSRNLNPGSPASFTITLAPCCRCWIRCPRIYGRRQLSWFRLWVSGFGFKVHGFGALNLVFKSL